MIIKTKKLCLSAIFVALIIIGTFIKIPLPYVPFTLQFLFTTLSGILLGPKLGSLTVLMYIILGLIGVPVFSEGGGIGYIFKPTFGYIIGFFIAAFFTGIISNKQTTQNFRTFLLASFVGLAIVYLFGIIHYYFISKFILGLDTTITTILLYGFVLAVPGDILLCIVSSIIAKRLKHLFLNLD